VKIESIPNNGVILERKKKIKILRIIARLNIGGPAIHVHLLTNKLNPEKFELKLITGKISPMEGDMSYLFNPTDMKPIIISGLQREINLRTDFQALREVFRKLIKDKPDIVHTHTAKAGVIARLAVMVYNFFSDKKIQTVHTFHGHVFERYFSATKSLVTVWIERFLAKFTDVIIAISPSQKRDLSKKYQIAPAQKIKIIELGFDLTPFLNSALLKGQFRRCLGINNDTLLIGIIGRLAPIKNHRMFLEVAKVFGDKYPNSKTKFIIVGDGELRKELELLTIRLGLQNIVYFLGWVKDVSIVYSDLDILSLTSLNEGTPVSIIEAMASRVPVISTDAGGVFDLVGKRDHQHQTNGYRVCERGVLCRKDDAVGFANGIRFIMDMPAQNKDLMLDRARTFVQQNYSRKRLIENIENLYFDLMQNETHNTKRRLHGLH
jgi:glycosyltransferase involved in cell wall biosynthesis